MNAYPRIPELAPQAAGETPEQFGVRAFGFLVRERVTVGVISAEARAAALHFSQLLVSAPDVLDATREQFHAVRLQLVRRAEEDRKQVATPEVAPTANVAPPAASLGGGAKVLRPVPPTRPTPPSAAVSPVTGRALPSADVIAQRLAAVQQRAAAQPRATVAQEDAL